MEEEPTEDVLDARELLMSQAQATLLEIEMLEDDVKERGVHIKGARGNEVANPSLAALAKHRTTLASLLKALQTPESRTDAAKRAARTRWAKKKNPDLPLDRVYVPKPQPNGNTDR